MKELLLCTAATALALFGSSCNSMQSSLAASPNSSAASHTFSAPRAVAHVPHSRTSHTTPTRKAPLSSPAISTMTVRTTAYSCKENEKGGIYGCKNAIGTNLRYGSVRSAAADWSRFPVGTTFKIAGQPHLYVIEDYGSALVGTNTIDIYKPSISMMNQWGVRHVPIQIVKWGSYERSAEILKGRTKYSHTRKMYYAIQPKLRKVAASDSISVDDQG